LADDDSPEQIAIEAEYHRLFREHGAYLATDLGPERFPARQKFVRDVTYWPVAVDLSSDERTAADVARWLDLFRNSRVKPFAIPIDEPHTAAQKERARHVAEVIGRAGGGPPRLLRAVTDAVLPVYEGVMDAFFSPKNFGNAPRPESGKLYFTYNGRPPE